MINPLDCTGKTILVTGASSGLGREISILLSQLGAKIVLIGRSETRLKETILLLSGKERGFHPVRRTQEDASGRASGHRKSRLVSNVSAERSTLES